MTRKKDRPSTLRDFVPGRGYTEADWKTVDSPEATDEQIAQAKPFADVFPDLAATIRKRGPERTKTPVSIRLDDDIVERLRASGPGWQSRVNDMLRKHIDKMSKKAV